MVQWNYRNTEQQSAKNSMLGRHCSVRCIKLSVTLSPADVEVTAASGAICNVEQSLPADT